MAIPGLSNCSEQECFLTKGSEGILSLARKKYTEDWLSLIVLARRKYTEDWL